MTVPSVPRVRGRTVDGDGNAVLQSRADNLNLPERVRTFPPGRIAVMALKHLGTRLLVSDFKASFRFYRDVLGFTPTFGDENDVYADFDTGGGTGIALFQRE